MTGVKNNVQSLYRRVMWRLSRSGCNGAPVGGGRRFLTSAQYAEIRRKRADLDAKLRQMTTAERARRR